jgi:hypothetical protein
MTGVPTLGRYPRPPHRPRPGANSNDMVAALMSL